ncbi:cyclin-dependent kinase-like 4 [Pseudomyrmex gracilis]|uniref:cyclin-dependent kinase-like 4 n=1 Tax=Pseudomyrmex gracilis TaxID=219809 RepID=UPI00099592B7|nr:cyclin-dependent kinase-like 4 [Pseudomyrmex gracilis]
MEKYENIEIVGEGSYGLVMKCRHRETGQIVAIKKFLETEEDVQVRKMAFREIKVLKKLRHENLVNMIEVFRRRKRVYLVFEYLDHTVLDELEETERGLDWEKSRKYIFQILRGLDFCHTHKIMHRDVKPENVLVSPNGVIKLCDFGFARHITGPNESCTDYVATRWYRAPELLFGESRYGRGIDVWAAGCLYAEMVTGQPLFPGDSDVDQLYRITKFFGPIYGKQSVVNSGRSHPSLRRAKVDEVAGTPRSATAALRSFFPKWNPLAIDFLAQCLRTDPETRPRCSALLQHAFFAQDGFADKFSNELQQLVAKETAVNPLSVNKKRETSSRICRSSTGRWHMTLIKETRATNNNVELEIAENENSRVARANRSLQANRSREMCYLGPISVIPNTTYIRRLEHKGLLLPDSKGCVLPALTPKTNVKRKKLDLSGVKNR